MTKSATPSDTSFTRRDLLWLLGIAALALLARIIVISQLASNNPGFNSPDVDSGWHFMWAKELARGNWIGTDVFYRAPLYPYLLGLWMTLFGDNLLVIRLVQALVGSLTAVLVALLGWRTLGRNIGLTAGFAWALYGTTIYYETELLIPVLIIPLNILALWMALGRMNQGRVSMGAWLPVGLILGASAIARPNILITTPVFLAAVWLAARDGGHQTPWSRRVPGLAALVIGLMLPILPVTIRNAVVGGDPVLIAYQGGVNLYLGNNPQADGITMQMPEISLDPTLSWDRFVGTTDSIARAEARRNLSPSEVSGFWTDKAVDYMIANPGETIGRWFKKLYYMLNGFEVGDQTDIYDFTRYSSMLRALIWHWGIFFPFGLIVPLAIVGMVLAWRRSLNVRLLIAFVILYTPSVVLFLATARHRLPIIPIFVIFAAGAVWIGREYWRKHKRIHLAMAAVATVALGILLNRPTVAETMHNPAYTLYQEALVYDRMGNYEKAIQLYGDALNIEPMLLAARRNLALALVRNQQFDLAITVSYSYLQFRQDDAEAINNLGLAYLGIGDTNKAMGSFRVAAGKNPKLPQPHINLGDIALARGETPIAIGAYGRAVNADSSYGPAYNALGVLLARASLPDSAIAVLDLCTKKDPTYPSCWVNLGNVLLQTGHVEEAISAMREAVALTPDAPAIRYNYAVALMQNGQLDEAERELRRVVEIDPKNVPAHTRLREIAAQRQP
ncbi:MAG: tetratricopeptide repeat protein [Candidatus Zixiibacteriota bacterium]